MAAQERKNTMRIQFGKDVRKPKDGEVFKFLWDNGITHDMLLAIYHNGKEFSVFVKFHSEKLLKDMLHKLPASMNFEFDDGTKARIRLSEAGQMIRYVRIFGLHPEIEDGDIAAELAKYGKVLQQVREKYSLETGYPVWSGVRGAHMEIENEIPANLYINHVQARIYYDGLQAKCFSCGDTSHFKAACTKRPSINNRFKTASRVMPGPPAGEVVSGMNGASFRDALIGQPLNNPEQSSETTENKKASASRARNSINGDEVYSYQPTFLDAIGIGGEIENQANDDYTAQQEVVVGGQETRNEFELVQSRKRGRKPAETKNKTQRETDSESSTTEAEHNHSDRAMIVPSAPSLLEAQALRTRSRSKQQKLAKK